LTLGAGPRAGARRFAGSRAREALTPREGAAAVASFQAAVLTEIYLCDVCSCQEILRRHGRG
jgi:hypothetical protein